jgi:hypothetical protein
LAVGFGEIDEKFGEEGQAGILWGFCRFCHRVTRGIDENFWRSFVLL